MKYKEEIIDELKRKGYVNRLINYQEFLQLYEPYKNYYTQKNFANIIGITDSNFDNIKNRGQRARILKAYKKEITQETKEKIIEELIRRGYRNKFIKYEEFQKLHEEFQEEIEDKKDFANVIGITEGNFKNMKNKGIRTRILKAYKKEITQETKKKIIEELIRRGYRNKLIKYEEFQKLHEEFQKEVEDEKDFANVIGITEGNFE